MQVLRRKQSWAAVIDSGVAEREKHKILQQKVSLLISDWLPAIIYKSTDARKTVRNLLSRTTSS